MGKTQTQELLVGTGREIKELLQDMETRLRHSLTESSVETQRLSEKMEWLFMSLGLTSSQEERVLEVVTNGAEEIRNAQVGLYDFHSKLTTILSKLNQIAPPPSDPTDLYAEVVSEYLEQIGQPKKDVNLHLLIEDTKNGDAI